MRESWSFKIIFLFPQSANERRFLINPFAPNARFLYSLKASENLTVFWRFHELEKACIGNEWVNPDKWNTKFSKNLYFQEKNGKKHKDKVSFNKCSGHNWITQRKIFGWNIGSYSSFKYSSNHFSKLKLRVKGNIWSQFCLSCVIKIFLVLLILTFISSRCSPAFFKLGKL